MQCAGFTKSGAPCRKSAMESSHYCAGHDPLRREFRTRRRCCKLMGLPVPAELQLEAGLTSERMEMAVERQSCVFDERMDEIARRFEHSQERLDAGGPLRFDFSGLLPPPKKKPAKRKRWKPWKWRRP